MKKLLIVSLLSLLPAFAFAATAWHVDPKASRLSFTATQNNAPVTGTFSLFTADIRFSPDDLANSKVSVTIDLASVTVPYGEVATMLKTDDWFAAATFPDALFESEKFTRTGENSYSAEGNLRLRDKKMPVTLAFVLEQYSADRAIAKGNATIRRKDFGVGQGQWQDTSSVKDDVFVEFTIKAGVSTVLPGSTL